MYKSTILICLASFLLITGGCSDQDVLKTNKVPFTVEQGDISPLRFYGMAYPRSKLTVRGVAQRTNLWYPCSSIKVKFLNDPYGMAEKVKNYAAEWENYAGIHFDFIEKGNAHVRIGFDWNDERHITWSYVGTDCKMVTDQNEATMSFAYWDSSTEEEIKGDVLRAFGLVLGLELEHRHLDFEPGWTSRIASYWENEIEDVTWDNLRQYVFDPLASNEVMQSAEYDENSIMVWPFSSRYAKNTARTFNYDLSDKDKSFIASIYPKCDDENVTDTLEAEELDIDCRDLYIDAPGNLYAVYSKGYFNLYLLDNKFIDISFGIGEGGSTPYTNWPYFKHTFGFCRNLNDTYYCVTSANRLLALPYGDAYGLKDLSDKFPANTVFLGLTASHDTPDVFVSTAMGDGSENHRKNYSTQKIYRIDGDGNITEVAAIDAGPVFNPDYMFDYSEGSDNHTEMLFPYSSVVAKSKGSAVYGLLEDGRYYKANIANGQVTYYSSRLPIQHLAGGTNRAYPVALSGRQVVELRHDQNSDRIIGSLPDSIGKPLYFLSNADQSIFYICTFEKSKNSGYYGMQVYRLRVNR